MNKICYYILYCGLFVGCNKHPKKQPTTPTSNRALIDATHAAKSLATGEQDNTSFPPNSSSPATAHSSNDSPAFAHSISLKEAEEQLKEDPRQSELYEFFKNLAEKQEGTADGKAWDTVILDIPNKKACKAATWLMHQGHVKLDALDQAGKEQLTPMLKKCMQAYQEGIDSGEEENFIQEEDFTQLVVCLAAQKAPIAPEQSTELLVQACTIANEKMLKGNYAVLLVALIQLGANPNIAVSVVGSNEQQTLLIWAIDNEDVQSKLLHTLVNHSAILINGTDQAGYTPAMRAATSKAATILNVLLQHGALDINTIQLPSSAPSHPGFTLLDFVVENCVYQYNNDYLYMYQHNNNRWNDILNTLLQRPGVSITAENIEKAQKHINTILNTEDHRHLNNAEATLKMLQEAQKRQQG